MGAVRAAAATAAHAAVDAKEASARQSACANPYTAALPRLTPQWHNPRRERMGKFSQAPLTPTHRLSLRMPKRRHRTSVRTIFRIRTIPRDATWRSPNPFKNPHTFWLHESTIRVVLHLTNYSFTASSNRVSPLPGRCYNYYASRWHAKSHLNSTSSSHQPPQRPTQSPLSRSATVICGRLQGIFAFNSRPLDRPEPYITNREVSGAATK